MKEPQKNPEQTEGGDQREAGQPGGTPPTRTTLTIRRSMVAKVSMVNLGTATVPAKAELAGQEEKPNQKNRTRQKFKKPKRLPYEETEVKSLEIGNLLEKEELKSLEGFRPLKSLFLPNLPRLCWTSFYH